MQLCQLYTLKICLEDTLHILLVVWSIETYLLTHRSLSLSIQNGWTPLITASYSGHVEVVCLLIDAHADIHTQNKVWYTGQPQPVHRLCNSNVLLWLPIHRMAGQHFTRHHTKAMLMWFVSWLMLMHMWTNRPLYWMWVLLNWQCSFVIIDSVYLLCLYNCAQWVHSSGPQ